MELTTATKILANESAGVPELRRTAQHVHDEYAAGRSVDHDTLAELVGRAADLGLLTTHRERVPEENEGMIIALLREVDRLSPEPVLV